ncbi:protein FAR1-RELATED SEQUENCE 5-like [Senna tora]|uniref:Protein FAR1-RELATED SEQUENCE 5-like n=1 Tax=Senna tora TaxID=362788 RepID=A0A834SYA5_9FABA|nr:protein FAR1-RELATED SEQUENCE 5-like [Senna tora]
MPTRTKKDKTTITSCRFVCCKEGLRVKDKRDYLTVNPRQETRTDCKAKISLVLQDGKLRVKEFVEEHNHVLHTMQTAHMLASQRHVSEIQAHEIELANDSGIQQRASFTLASMHVGGRDNLGYTRLDQKNYLRTRRQNSMKYGEAGSLLGYFQDQISSNPSFFHAFQMDSEEQITNIFWADARMQLDYGYFGDVISLDTTYCTNNAHRPLALFSGFNHHRGVVIFGAALLYDETTASFNWLFETFLKAHNQKKPLTMFTDQDQAMAKAIQEVFPNTCHGLCTWHLMQNGIKHLGNLMKNGSHFLQDFKACMYRYEEETEFEAAWSKILLDYNVHENTWIRSIYSLKEKWAACYMKRFLTLGMRSTQLSESLNADVKRCLKPDVDILQFFKHFELVVEDKRYNELKCEFEAREKVPRLRYPSSPMIQQLAKVYTPTIFEMFQDQIDLFFTCCVKQRRESESLIEYVINMLNHKGEWKVLFYPQEKSISCTCRKFENFGILCCHAVKAFEANDVKEVPDQYILKRWSKNARIGVIFDVNGREVEEDPKLVRTLQYKSLCKIMIKLASDVSGNHEEVSLVQSGIDELINKVMTLRLGTITTNRHQKETSLVHSSTNDTITPSSIDTLQPTGIKKRQGRKSSKRLKSSVEVRLSRTSSKPTVKNSQSEQSTDIGAQSQVQFENPFSFTKFSSDILPDMFSHKPLIQECCPFELKQNQPCHHTSFTSYHIGIHSRSGCTTISVPTAPTTSQAATPGEQEGIVAEPPTGH